MKQKLILLACTIFSTLMFSQGEPTAFEDWKTTLGTQNFYYKNSTKTDSYGNVFVAGATMNGATTDILIAKYTPGGQLIWIKQIAGTATGGVDFIGNMFVTDTHVYVTGAISNNTVTPETDLVTMQLASSTGSVVWSTTYQGTGSSHDAGKAIYVDGSGNVFVSGSSYNASLNADYVTLRYNSSGFQQWVTLYDYASGDDAATGIQNSGSNINVGGAVSTTTAGVYRSAIVSIAKTTGSIVATSASTAVTTTSVDVVSDYATDGTNLILVGTNNVTGQGKNIYVQKFGATLLSTWTYTYNGANLDDAAKAVQVDGSSNVYIAAYTTSATLGREITLIKLNSSGTQQFVVNSGFTGDDEASDLTIDASNNLYITGYKTSAIGDKNYYTAKYNSSGTKIWEVETERTIGLNEYATNIALDSLDNVIVTGQSEAEPGVYEFLTCKYIQRDIQIPIEATPENPSLSYIFYENKGQILNATGSALEPDVTHSTMNAYPGLFFKPKTFSYKLYNFDTLSTVADTTQRIDITLEDGIEGARAYSLQKSQGLINLFDAKLPNNITDIQGYSRMVAPEVYSGIDAHYYSNANGLKIYYVVKPGADPRQIKWNISGANATSVVGTDLEIQGINHKIVYDQPTFYQTNLAGTTTSTLSAGTWTNVGSNQYSFNLPTYNSLLPLLIELDHGNPSPAPSASIKNLELCVFYGGARDEGFKAIKSSPVNGRYVVTGTTKSYGMDRDFPTGGTNTSTVSTAYTYLTLVMFDSIGQRICANIYGGYSDIEPTDVIIHGNTRRVTVTGNTYSSSMITPYGPFLTLGTYSNTAGPGFVIQFEQANGQSYSTQSLNYIKWQTRLNGMASNMALTPDNNYLYITSSTNGSVNAPDLMTKANAYNNSTNIGRYQFQISKYSWEGVRQWATYFPAYSLYAYSTNSVTYSYNNSSAGTSFEETLKCRIECDNYGFVIAGEAKTSGLPIFNKYHVNMDSTYNGQTDAFVARFNRKDSLVFSQYIGGSAEDGFLDLKVTKPNEITLVGYSQSPEYEDLTYRSSLSQYIDTVMPNGATKMLITKLDTTGQKLWSTFYGNGNSAPCLAWSVTSDAKKNIYMTGTTYGSFKIDVPNNSNVMDYTTQLDLTSGTAGIGEGDAFMLSFDSLNTLVWNTYFGGRYDDAGLALDYNIRKNRVMIVGVSNTPKYKPFGSPGLVFPTCYPLGWNPLTWITEHINASTGQGSLSFSAYDGYIGWWMLDQVVGIEEYFKDKFSEETFHLYPNPAVNETYIAFKNKLEGKTTIEVYSVTGQLLYSDTKNNIFDHTVISLPTASFSNGIYVVNVKNNSNFISKKLVISK